MSDRAEFYRRYPRFQGPGEQEMREPDRQLVRVRPNVGNSVSSWMYDQQPNYTTWRLLIPADHGVLPVYYVLFEWDGRFLQANGMGYLFYDMYCFFKHLEEGAHESEVCRRAV